MPNHLHTIIYLDNNSPEINKVIGEAKRLFSYSIVSKLKKLNQLDTIIRLQNFVSDYEITCSFIRFMGSNSHETKILKL